MPYNLRQKPSLSSKCATAFQGRWYASIDLAASSSEKLRHLDQLCFNEQSALQAPVSMQQWQAGHEALFSRFSIQKSASKTRDAEDGFGRSIEPRAPQSGVAAPAEPALTRKSKRASPSKMKIKE